MKLIQPLNDRSPILRQPLAIGESIYFNRAEACEALLRRIENDRTLLAALDSGALDEEAVR